MSFDWLNRRQPDPGKSHLEPSHSEPLEPGERDSDFGRLAPPAPLATATLCSQDERSKRGRGLDRSEEGQFYQSFTSCSRLNAKFTRAPIRSYTWAR